MEQMTSRTRMTLWLGTLAISVIAIVTIALRYPDGVNYLSPSDFTATSDRPNIVLIVTDDQRSDTLQFMPFVSELLVTRGTLFTHAFATTPLCCPSRASILTGEYAHNHGVLGNTEPYGFPAFDDDTTLATRLSDAGYRTALVGKYLNDYPRDASPYIPPGWDTFIAFTGRPGYLDYTLAEYDGNAAREIRYGNDTEDYSTDVLADHATRFLNATEDEDDRPFFLYFTPFAPHTDIIAAERHISVYDDLAPYDAPSLNEEDVGDKRGRFAQLPSLTQEQIDEINALREATAESLLAVDECIAEIVTWLDAHDETRDTIVIFMGDNGFHWGEHRIVQGKATPYEESIRVPLFIVDGQDAHLQSIDALALNIDIMPTLLAFAGIEIPSTVDGMSLLPLLSGSSETWRTDFLAEGWSGKRRADFLALREDEWMLIEHTTGGWELYDLIHDPYQLENVVDDPANADRVARMKERLDELETCTGNTCRSTTP